MSNVDAKLDAALAIDVIQSPDISDAETAAWHLRQAAAQLCCVADLVEKDGRHVPLFSDKKQAMASGDERRSEPGKGSPVWIYVLGRADEHADCVVPAYGKISAGCGPNINEDFANCGWPVVVKVKPGVREADFVQHLRDLADLVETHCRPDGVFETHQSLFDDDIPA